MSPLRSSAAPRPRLSLVVAVYDMAREAPRTLHSLSTAYQLGVTSDDYEVLVVENPSQQPLDPRAVGTFGPNFRYLGRSSADSSPAAAINQGLAEARGEWLAVLVDGARLLSPGFVAHALLATRLAARPVIAVPGFHLGPDLQPVSTLRGYGTAAEDRLLASIGWPADGYRLFEISVFAGSSKGGWFQPMAESNALVVSRSMADELGGLDEGFRSPGGGLCNLDYYARACALDGARLVMLLGEGTFHQTHGGVTTAAGPSRWNELHDEYMALRGQPFVLPEQPALFLGTPHPSVLDSIAHSVGLARA